MTRARLLCSLAICLAIASPSAAQTLSGFNSTSGSRERLSENHWKLIGEVELEQKDTKLYADEVDIYIDQDRAVAKGNVVFTQGTNRIAADSADFNTKTRLGTFYAASGIATVQPPRQNAAPGAFVPPTSNQPTDVYFFGEVVEKIGAKKYKITNGGFSTCVQPTPRWDMNADTITLNIDHYTFLRNAILNVKGVPMFYLPVLYYPTNEDGRATGFLLPTYGASSLRGQAIHNAFFWAINRSQDATIMHDWYSKAGQGFGSEYRYNFGGGSDGSISGLMLDQKAATSGAGGLSETKAYFVRGSANQMLPGNLRARFQADYFSNFSVMQTFNTNVYDATRNQRAFGANVVGAWRTFSLNATYERREQFGSPTQSWLTGSTPRVTLARNERPLFKNSPVYFGVNSDFSRLDRETRVDGKATDDSSLTRIDFAPQVRFPFKKWQWFTVNSTVSWRETYYTRSYAIDAEGNRTISDTGLNRQYYTMQAQAIGPVFNRIFNTPNNGYAERWKHTVEPFLNVTRVSSIDNFLRIVPNDPGTDTIVGNTTNYSYGLNNRFYAKRPSAPGRPSVAQEIASIEIVQTYYTQAAASQFDNRYTTSFGAAAPSNFSPVQVSIRATPTPAVNAQVRAEIDSKHKELRTLSANSNYNWSNRVSSQIGWTKTFFIAGLSGFDNRDYLQHSLQASTNVHTADNRIGTMHSFNYDIHRAGLLQQRVSAFYNAQCCGIAFEYQTFNYGGVGSGLSDRRFFLSFTLAGLGNFSPFNGAMGGMPR